MLLRRVIENVRDQNWFAVFLDFVIVVVGVFIGIQVANWNGDRLNQREERILVERLRVDFERIREDSDRSLAFHERMTSSLRTVVRSLRSETLKDEDVAVFEQALVFGITFQTSADHSGTFTELMSSGRANILRDRNLLDDLVDYEDFLSRFDFAQQYYIDLVMGSLEAYTSAFGYAEDLQLSQALFEGRAETEALVSYDFDALTADPAFENAAEQMMFVHSGFVLWRQRISERVDAIQQRLSEVRPAKYFMPAVQRNSSEYQGGCDSANSPQVTAQPFIVGGIRWQEDASCGITPTGRFPGGSLQTVER